MENAWVADVNIKQENLSDDEIEKGKFFTFIANSSYNL